MTSSQQVKSKERVAKHGEVFTAEREVKTMCDLVKHETERIDSRFLEPACGDGNFLAEVLRRKLSVVEKRYGKSPYDYERYSVLAISSLYGVDILPDNAEECRKRLFEIWDEAYTAHAKNDADDMCRDAVHYILCKNIICGDALTLCRNDGSPIVFAEWSLVSGSKIQRRDYMFTTLLRSEDSKQMTLEDTANRKHIGKTGAFIPIPYKDDYPLTDYWKVQDDECC